MQQIKYAEFRQNWINNLREHIAIFQAQAFLNPREAHKKGSVAESMLMIMLLIDRKNVHYDELKFLLYQVMTYTMVPTDPRNPFSDNPFPSYLPDNPLFDAQSRFIEISQDILKLEWEETKKGLRSLPSDENGGRRIKTVWSIGSLRLGKVPKVSKGTSRSASSGRG
ncbi:hypothetical protein EON80_17480 [bacterium]|nr:MAG: hypothetical protein EON80_17480 [bacterium]